jgi:hypothetical protein
MDCLGGISHWTHDFGVVYRLRCGFSEQVELMNNTFGLVQRPGAGSGADVHGQGSGQVHNSRQVGTVCGTPTEPLDLR